MSLLGASNVTVTRDASTLANKYEVLLLEKGGDRFTQERTSLVFRVLDELIPNMGVFTQVLKNVRDEMFDVVFSDKYTTSTSEDKGSFIQRVPYFRLVQDIFHERDENSESLKEQLDIVKEKLFNKHKLYEEAQDKIEELETQIVDLSNNIKNLKQKLSDSQHEVASLNETLDDERRSSQMTQHNLNCDISELKSDLKEARSEIAYLNKFKKGYDELEAAFNEPIGVEKKKHPVLATKHAHLINNIQSAIKIENQILFVQNAMIEEYDKFLEEHKKEMKSQAVYEDPRDPKYVRSEVDIEQADQELWAVEERFKKANEDIDNELELVRQHLSMLEEQVQLEEELNPTIQLKKKSLKDVTEAKIEGIDKEQQETVKGILRTVSRPTTQNSILSAGLNEKNETDNMEDPFIPHERVFSKYAAMMYTSSNKGKNWHEFPDARYCPSCGEKTMICPHKLGGKEQMIRVPHGCSHIKITRPKVKINKELIREVLRKESTDSDSEKPSSSSSNKASKKKFKSLSSMLGKVGASSRANMFDNMSTASTPSADANLVHPLPGLLDDYRDRTTLQRTIPRPLKMERAVSLIEQFYSFTVWQDETGQEEDDGFFSMLDNLYYFMSARYMKENIAYLTTFDLLSAIVESSAANKIVHVFGHILVGNLDGAVFRYLLMMSDFIDLVDWKDVGDFRVFASIIYPALADDDIETLHMGYTSYSENKISKKRVLEFLTYLVLKYREPRFQDLEAKLVQYATNEPGQFSYAEYNEALDQVLPVHNDILRKRLFWESEAHLRMDNLENVVTVSRLAQITGYLGLVQISHIIKESVAIKVSDARANDPDRQGLPIQIPQGDDSIMTHTSVRGLAVNINRRKQNRDRRLKEEEELYT